MSNVHTLSDIGGGGDDAGRSGVPFPDAWGGSGHSVSGSRTGAGADLEFGGGDGGSVSPQQLQLSFAAVDGSMSTTTIDISNKKSLLSDIALVTCCPCCIGGPCSQPRRAEWINYLKRVTAWLIFIQLVLFIVSLSLDGFASVKNNPQLGPPAESLVKLGAKYAWAMRYEYQVFRFITPVFLHAGIFHLLGNLYSEFKLCVLLEKRWGVFHFSFIYIVSGLGATVFSCMLNPNSVSVGASGALMGIMGAYLVEILFVGSPRDATRKLELIQIGFFIVFTLLISFAPYIDFSAHLGGLLTGFFVGCFIFLRPNQTKLENFPKLRLGLQVGGLIGAVLVFLINMPLFYTVIEPVDLNL
ncbi:membrane protein [Pelomyxa schiedti]|nr:membrane protein [Pelomyxa schiedti]